MAQHLNAFPVASTKSGAGPRIRNDVEGVAREWNRMDAGEPADLYLISVVRVGIVTDSGESFRNRF
jgi:hypothetical protein